MPSSRRRTQQPARNGRAIARVALATLFVAAGINHFVTPAIYLAIMPPGLRWPRELLAVSGVAEIVGGVGILWRKSRRLAGWGLVALLVAVFPANVQAAFGGMTIAGHHVPSWLLWARLPLQVPLIWLVYWSCRA